MDKNDPQQEVMQAADALLPSLGETVYTRATPVQILRAATSPFLPRNERNDHEDEESLRGSYEGDSDNDMTKYSFGPSEQDQDSISDDPSAYFSPLHSEASQNADDDDSSSLASVDTSLSVVLSVPMETSWNDSYLPSMPSARHAEFSPTPPNEPPLLKISS